MTQKNSTSPSVLRSYYEPTLSGFSQMPEDHDRENKVITVMSTRQYEMFKMIERIDPVDLEPWGPLPLERYPSKRYWWQRRTPDWKRPTVWCRLNASETGVTFEVYFGEEDGYSIVYVPLDSWCRCTCDPEAVRAAIQQDYLNHVRGVHHHVTVVKPRMKSLQVITWEEFKTNRRYKRFSPLPVPFAARWCAAEEVLRRSIWTTAYRKRTTALQNDGGNFRWMSARMTGEGFGRQPVAGFQQQHHTDAPDQRHYQPQPSWPLHPSSAVQYETQNSNMHVHRYPEYLPGRSAHSGHSSVTLTAQNAMFTPVSSDTQVSMPTTRGMSETEYLGPSPPLRSERHSSTLSFGYVPSSDGTTRTESEDQFKLRERVSWLRRIFRM